MSNIRNRGSVRVAPHVTDPSLQAKSQTEQLLAELGEDDIPTPEPLEQPSQPHQSNMLVIVFVLIIIALVAIIIWLFTKGNNQEKEKEEEVLRRLSADPRRRWAANQYASPNQYAMPNDQRNQSHQLTRQQGMHPSQMQVPEWSNEQALQQAQLQQQAQQAQLQQQALQAQQQQQALQAQQQPKPAQPSQPAQQAQPVLTSPLMENKGPSVDEVLQQTAPVNLNKIDQEMLSAVAAERIAAAEETN